MATIIQPSIWGPYMWRIMQNSFFGRSSLHGLLPESYNISTYHTSQTIEINPNNCDLDAFLTTYKENKCTIQFEFNDGYNRGIGQGASRTCMTILLERIIDYYFDIVDNWFIILKKSIPNDIVIAMSEFIESCIKSDILLPKHLHPKFVEDSVGIQLNVHDLLYYLEKMDYDMYGYVNRMDESYKVDSNKFQEIAPGFESFEEMLRARVIGKHSNDSMLFFDFRIIKYKNAMQFDKDISEPYKLTNEIVAGLFNIYEYSDMWRKFVMSLTQKELKSMLILFTGTSNVTQTIMILIDNEYVSNDLSIHTCGYNLSINRRLFASQTTLDGLKIYFSCTNDTVDDSGGMYRTNHNRLNIPESTESTGTYGVFNNFDVDGDQINDNITYFNNNFQHHSMIPDPEHRLSGTVNLSRSARNFDTDGDVMNTSVNINHTQPNRKIKKLEKKRNSKNNLKRSSKNATKIKRNVKHNFRR